MRNPLGYKVLRTYQQGEEIYQLTKEFTAKYLHSIKDSRLISHMNDSGRSVPRNIAEGYGRNNTKQYYEFLGFAFGSLLELLEDYLGLEKDIKEGLRDTKDNKGVQRDIRDTKGGQGVTMDSKGGQWVSKGNNGILRTTKDNEGELRDISKAIKLCMGEKTMLKRQMERIEEMVGEQGLMSNNQRIAKVMTENRRKEQEFDKWLKSL